MITITATIMIFTFYMPYFISMGLYLFSFSFYMPFCVIMIFLPIIISNTLKKRLYSKNENNNATDERKIEIYEEYFTKDSYIKEIRQLGIFMFLCDKYILSIKNVVKANITSAKESTKVDCIMRLLSVAGFASVLGLLTSELLHNRITIGLFSAVIISFNMMYGIANEAFSGVGGVIARKLPFIDNYYKLMDFQNEEGTTSCLDGKIYNENNGVVFDNVSYKYNNADSCAICGISLNIEAGETVAIVGENGASKSTLAALLLGMYFPTEGSVRVGGIETSPKNENLYMPHSSAVFQNFLKYKMSLRENIAISDNIVNRDDCKIYDACGEADLTISIENFPDGLDTLLAPEFGGVDVSGGIWQRIAIARGLYRMHDIILLDEPTASIDPVEESNIYKKFAEISKGKTSIIITHRLGAAKIADRIIVLRKGKIVEEGKHEDLMELNGYYASMYKTQQKWYIDK